MKITVRNGLKERGKVRRTSGSTKRFFQEARQAPDFSIWDFLHGYVYARWPYLYIGVGTGEHPLTSVIRPIVAGLSKLFAPRGKEADSGRGFADSYHGKVVPTEAAKQLVSIREDICLRDLEKIIPYSMARDLILKNPDHIVALECPCRAAREDPCEPLDVCLIVGEPFASFVREHHPRRSRWISSSEAEEILQAENELGHVHHAFFKDAMLGRFYAICNCCPCCCGAMQAMRNGTPMLSTSGYISVLDPSLCIACGDCVESCPFSALVIQGLSVEVDPETCMGCGVCVTTCELSALALERAPERGFPLEITTLMAEFGQP
jgi:ferredoxin